MGAAILIPLAISAATAAASYGVDYLIAKKQKVAPVDRGKLDDVRLSIPGYGEAIVKGWGKFRCAPVWVDYTPVVHTTVVTQGSSGGKGPPKPPTPQTVDHIYTQSVFGVFHDGLINNVTRIWFDSDLVWNTSPALSADRYEAEDGTLTGSASTTSSSIASGGVKVTGLGNTGKVSFSVSIPSSGDYDIAVFYLDSTSDLVYNVYVDGTLAGSLSCPQSGTGLMAVQTLGLTLTSGTRTIRFENTGASCPDMDRIEVVQTVAFSGGSRTDARTFTGLSDPNIGTPVNQTKPWAAYNIQPIEIDPGGPGDPGGTGPLTGTSTLTGTLTKWGNPQIVIYRGTTTQDADPTFVAVHGAANTPAYRGYACISITGIQLQNGRLPNVTIEVDQGTTAVDQIVKDTFALGGIGNSLLDVTALSGLTITGVLRPSRVPLADTLKDLQTRFQFDLVEIDGVVKAVLRNRSTPDATIPYAKLRAHDSSAEVPTQDAVITDIDPLQLPARVNVNYVSPGHDYHNNVQFDQRLAGIQYDEQSYSLSLVDNEDNMKRLASTLLYQPEQEGRTFDFETGPEFNNLVPGSIVSLQLPNATHTARISDVRMGLPAGVISFSAVRQAPSIYSPTGSGSVGGGVETPVAGFPSNSKGIIIEGPIFRPEDLGDGTQPVVYFGACGIGGGAWPGGFLEEERPIGSGNYTLLPSASGISIFDKPSGLGVTAGTLADGDPTVWDRTNSVTINLYYDPGLSSATEDQLLMNPELNLIVIQTPDGSVVECLQFKTATAGAASSPYVAQYTLSTFLRGRFHTEWATAGHTSADDVAIMDSTIKPRRMAVEDIGR